MNEFVTEFKSRYTVEIKSSSKGAFISKYKTKQTVKVVTIEDRPKNTKYKSRIICNDEKNIF